MEVEQKTEKPTSFKLPSGLVGSVDMNRLIRELEVLDDFLYQAQIRTPGTSVQAPRSSRMLEELASINHHSLLDQAHRSKLLEALKKVELSAPSVHISFAVDPSPKFVQKIVAWMREHLHEHVMVEVGLQPTIAVGCMVRTDNKIFDMSLRHRFMEYRAVLVAKIAEQSLEATTGENPESQSEGGAQT